MSKATVKKLIRSMLKEDIIEMVIEMSDARKEEKEYLEYYAKPDENGKLVEYKDIICAEFYPKECRLPKARFSVCRKAVADFKKLKLSAYALSELMLSYKENAIEFTHDFGDMSEQYYESVEGNFAKTVELIAKNGLWEKFDKRFLQCVFWASACDMVSLMVLMTYTRRQGVVMFKIGQNLGNVLMLLANLEESGTGIRHEVGLAAFGIDGYADFGYYYQVTLGKSYGTGIDGLLLFFAEHAHLRCKPVKGFLHFVLLLFIHGLRHCCRTFLLEFLHRVLKHRHLFLHDIVLHHIRHDEAIATHNDDEHKHGLIA